ncbi:hypothetical protein [Bradyrhizobium erythrophlei]|uniref:Uncharacterized protein n=1 Tax=Bradyrhizobium erythrophlei TaxID=1437360 RepID=A0A1H4VDY0_9BRAD|nr:hypothetical protein [Bradyrhizobium erythrophlei]SEC79080.1 hypothetical protein SAMN05444164_2760 [Bradyrhizobium erythrophlei]
MTTRISHVARTFRTTTFRTIALAVALSAITATAASAQAAISEPAAYQALYPYRDVLNNGAPTPAARLVLLPPAVLQALQAQESGIGVVRVPRRSSHRAGR